MLKPCLFNLADKSVKKLAKIASFIKAYNEMRSGEEFVAKETVARARMRNRMGLFAAQFVLGVLLLWAAFSHTKFLNTAKQKMRSKMRQRFKEAPR